MKINIRKIQEALNKRGSTSSQRSSNSSGTKPRRLPTGTSSGRRPQPRRKPCNCGGRRMFR